MTGTTARSHPPDDDQELNRLLEQYTALLRTGNAPPIEEFAARHPGFEDQILELYPILSTIESIGDGP